MEIIETYNMLVPLLAILLGSANSADPSTPRFTVTNVCYVDYGIELTNLTLDSLLACCSKCLLNDECQTVVYDEADKLCRLNAAKALTLQVSECDNTVRYAEFKTGEYAFECITDDDCTNKNPMLYCADKQCECTWGYRYNPRDDTCLPGCARYGDEFDIIPGFRLEQNNDKQLDNATQQDAIDSCINEESFTCISIDCYNLYPVCWLSKESVVTRPMNIEQTDEYNYLQRKCV